MKQIKLLLWKQTLVLRRNVKLLIFQFLSPVFISLFLVYLEHLAVLSLDHSDVHPATHSLNHISACTGPHCSVLGVGYTHGPVPWTDYVLTHIAVTQGFHLGTDIRVLSESDPLSFIKYLSTHVNETAVGVLFCTGEFALPQNPVISSMDCSSADAFLYSIFLNSTNVPNIFMTRIDDPMPIDHRVLAIKVAVDQAILNYKAQLLGLPEVSFDVETQDFPHTASRFLDGYDVIAVEGAFWFFIPPMVIFIIMLTELVREKEFQLRIGMTVMGMRGRAYWVSWFLVGFGLVFVSSNVLIFTGYVLRFDFFLKTPYLILLMLFAGFALAMMMLAFLLSTLISTLKTAYTVSYAFLLLGLVLQLFMTNVVLLYLLYVEAIPRWIQPIRFILPFYPPFNFSKAFGDIARRSARRYSGRSSMWEENEGFSWYHFVHPIHARFGAQVPSTLISILSMLMDILVFGLLGWFCDHVIADNSGSGE